MGWLGCGGFWLGLPCAATPAQLLAVLRIPGIPAHDTAAPRNFNPGRFTAVLTSSSATNTQSKTPHLASRHCFPQSRNFLIETQKIVLNNREFSICTGTNESRQARPSAPHKPLPFADKRHMSSEGRARHVADTVSLALAALHAYAWGHVCAHPLPPALSGRQPCWEGFLGPGDHPCGAWLREHTHSMCHGRVQDVIDSVKCSDVSERPPLLFGTLTAAATSGGHLPASFILYWITSSNPHVSTSSKPHVSTSSNPHVSYFLKHWGMRKPFWRHSTAGYKYSPCKPPLTAFLQLLQPTLCWCCCLRIRTTSSVLRIRSVHIAALARYKISSGVIPICVWIS